MSNPADWVTATFTVVNPEGLHARPAAVLVEALAALDASVRVTKPDGTVIAVTGPTAILMLGARQGEAIDFSASGPDATQALDLIGRLIAEGFGEVTAAPAAPAARTVASPMGVSPGRVVGPVVRMPEPIKEPAQAVAIAEARRSSEADRITRAVATVAASLRERASRVTGEAREILEASALMAADPTLLDDARGLVATSGESPERATWIAVTAFAEILSAQGGRMAERAADVHDLRNRLVAAILGRPVPGVPDRTEPFVLVARDLAPADAALLDPATCLALVTEEGGPTSHTAILARSLGIPAIVAARGALEIAEGTTVLVDGTTGTLEVDPSARLIAEVAARRALAVFSGTGQTKDGHAVQLFANVGSAESVAAAVAAKAEGVGLFRTEFCFLGRDTAPSVAEQVAAYRPVFAAFPGRKVVVRTLDAGADKPLAFVTAAQEGNPALGIRGYRTSWRNPGLLAEQLVAIAQAAAAEKAIAWVMAPMVATVEEAAEFAATCAAHGLETSGVMVETPAAAVMAAEILSMVDFVSIGTNDLAQYTMAADRLVGEFAALHDPWQPAVLRLIETTAQAGVATGKPVGVCGEAAADPLLAAVLVGLGVSSLSMSATAIAAVAHLLAGVTLAQCVAAASAARGSSTAAGSRAAAAGILA